MTKSVSLLSALLLSIILYGCASGGKGGSIEITKDDLSKKIELPKEVQDSFEVKGIEKPDSPSTADAAEKVTDSSMKPKESTGKETEQAKEKEVIEKVKSKNESASTKVKTSSPKPKDAKSESKNGPYSLNIRKEMRIPFSAGDKVVFDMSYFGVKAGTLTFEVLDNKMINDREVFHFKGTVRSAKMFDLFYRVDDYMQTFVDVEGFYPLKNEMVLDESRQVKKTLEVFDHKSRHSYFKSWRKHTKKGVKEEERDTEFPQNAIDTLSSLYYLRMFPLKVGDKVKFPVVSDGRAFDATAEVLRKEKVTVEAGTFNTVVLKPETRFEGKLKKMGDIFFWITDDEKHQLIKIKAKIKIGALYAEATEISP